MPRICYFCPDFPQPSGGVKILYRHVRRLCDRGFDACLIHQKHGFMAEWQPERVPVLWLEDRPRFSADDIWVLPEVMADFARPTRQFAGRRVLFAQSWLPTLARLQPGERWQNLGVTHALTQSAVIQQWLEWSMALPVTRIPPYVDSGLYTHRPHEKQHTITYMTRKDAAGEWLRGALTRRGEPFTSFQWTPLRGLDEAGYAHALAASTLYLATTVQEGLHLSVLEAMACGCLVIGFHGVGGQEYMVGTGAGQNCILAENGDLPALGRALESTILRLNADRGSLDAVIASAIRTAQRFQDPQAEADALDAFFRTL